MVRCSLRNRAVRGPAVQKASGELAGSGLVKACDWRKGVPLPYITGAGLRGAIGDTIPGPIRSIRELSLPWPLGLGTWRPPTL